MHVVVHPSQDGVGHGLSRVATIGFVALQFLNPFEIDHRHNTDAKVDFRRDIDRAVDHGASQGVKVPASCP